MHCYSLKSLLGYALVNPGYQRVFVPVAKLQLWAIKIFDQDFVADNCSFATKGKSPLASRVAMDGNPGEKAHFSDAKFKLNKFFEALAFNIPG